MKFRLSLAVASVAALAACNSAANNSTATANGAAPAATSAPAATGAPAAPATEGRTVNPQLQQQLAQAAQIIRPQLPIRQPTPNGELVISNIEANGGELIYTMEVPTDLTAASFAQFEQQLPVQACANPQARQLFEQGGAYTYVIKDSGGEEFRASVSSC